MPEASNVENCIQAIELTKVFQHPSKEGTNISLFAACSFTFKAHTANFLIGKSGSGKTTLLKMIMGIEPITAGELFFNDLTIHTMTFKEKCNYLRKIGYVTQFPALYIEPMITVKENIDYSFLLHKKSPREEREKKIEEIATAFDIKPLLNQKTHTLSSGELRRVNLACSLIFDPVILLCDEPTGHLDKESKNSVLNYLIKASDISDAVVLIATHDLNLLGEFPAFEIKQRRVQKYR